MTTRRVLLILVLMALGFPLALALIPPIPIFAEFGDQPAVKPDVIRGDHQPAAMLLKPEPTEPNSSAPVACVATHRPLETGRAPSGTTSAEQTLDARLLIVAEEDGEATLEALCETLDYLGTPYSVWVARQRKGDLTMAHLANGKHGFYQGIIFTTGSLTPSNDEDSGLRKHERDALAAYESSFGVRRAIWNMQPEPAYGYATARLVGAPAERPPVMAKLTEAGRGVFSYINPAAQIPISGVDINLAQPAAKSLQSLALDASGNALVAIHTDKGREQLLLTFEGGPDQVHTLALTYGVINWVTRGLFLGERHVYMSPQIDDVLLPNDVWQPGRSCDETSNRTGATFRLTGADVQAVVDWQKGLHARPTTKDIRLEMAFNGYGASGLFSPETLTDALRRHQAEFKWVSHTWDHTNLDKMAYPDAHNEVAKNIWIAPSLGLNAANGNWNPNSMVTPEVSGLENPFFIRAAYDTGIRYLVSDTSVPGYANPSPNTGIYNRHHPEILMIPRYASILDFNVSTPAEWVAQYNCLYGPNGTLPPHERNNRDLSYAELLDRESDQFVRYMLKGDINPLMFHQGNLRAYDGMRTLLGDLLDATFAKYDRIFNLPILSPPMGELGRRVANRMQYNAANVTATIVRGQSITLTATKPATVPVTGVRNEGAEVYGGQTISYITLGAGQSVTVSLR